MANVLTKNPWIIDTAGTTELATRADQKLKIIKFRWVGATATHDLVVTDSDGDNIYVDKCVTTNTPQQADFPGGIVVSGLKVPTMGSGTLYVHFGL